MAIAVIGLVGVIAGALLGGLVTLYVDRVKLRRQAVVAGRLISTELEAIRTRMQGSVNAGQWWVPDLPTEAWKSQQESLGVLRQVNRDLPTTTSPSSSATVSTETVNTAREPGERAAASDGGTDPSGLESAPRPETTATKASLLTELAKTYATVDWWNGSRAFAVPKSPADGAARANALVMPGETVAELSESIDDVKNARTSLENVLNTRVDTPARRRVGWSGRVVASAVILAVVVGLVLAAREPRPNVTSETVATTLEGYYGPSAFVRCDPASVDWTCTVYELAGPRQRCLSAPAHALPTRDATGPSLAPAADVTFTCPAKVAATDAVVKQGQDLVILPKPGELAVRGPTRVIAPRRSFMNWLGGWFTNH